MGAVLAAAVAAALAAVLGRASRQRVRNTVRTALWAAVFAADLTAVLAASHGVSPAEFCRLSPARLLDAVISFPVDEGFLKDASAATDLLEGPDRRPVGVFRAGCPDCEAVFPIFPAGSVRWVSSAGAVGGALCERFAVTDVPAFLVEGPDGWRLAGVEDAVEAIGQTGPAAAP